MAKKTAPTCIASSQIVTIDAGQEKTRLDKALTALLAGQGSFSRVRIQSLIKEGHVSRAGKPVSSATYKVKEGETYQIMVPPPEPDTPEAQDIELNVVFEDKDLLVIDKPVGMVVHPAPGNRDRTLVNALLAHCGKSLSGIGGVARPGIVHRLDKDTSGLMVVAKNDKAHQALSSQFTDRSLSRTYHAIVWGVPTPSVGEIEGPIGRHPHDRKKMTVTLKGKDALTYYKVIEVFAGASLVECKLATGRTHQIRVHLSARKHAVVGDPVYSAQKNKSKNELTEKLRLFPRQALHAVALQFVHPRSGKTMRFTSKVPKDIAGLLRALRKKT